MKTVAGGAFEQKGEPAETAPALRSEENGDWGNKKDGGGEVTAGPKDTQARNLNRRCKREGVTMKKYAKLVQGKF